MSQQSINQDIWNGSLVVIGLSHHTAPIELRERVAVALDGTTLATETPNVVLATCNRTEVYAWSPSGADCVSDLRAALAKLDPEAEQHLYERRDFEALHHLVRVAAGLDSLVLGDEQIRGQVAVAHQIAAERTRLPAPLDATLRRAQEAARRVRAVTDFGHHPSVAASALEIAVGDRSVQESALVLGSGTMAKAAARFLLERGWSVTLCGRTEAHARRTAQLLPGAQVVPWEDLAARLAHAEVVVGATASRLPVLTLDLVRNALAVRSATSDFTIVDLALPRDVDPSVRDLAGVRLIDLDDLEHRCPADERSRRAAVERAEALARAESERAERWLRERAAAPAIVALRKEADAIRQAELRRASRQLGTLTPEQQRAVDLLTRSLVNKLLHRPTVALRATHAAGPGSNSDD